MSSNGVKVAMAWSCRQFSSQKTVGLCLWLCVSLYGDLFANYLSLSLSLIIWLIVWDSRIGHNVNAIGKKLYVKKFLGLI